MKERKQGLEREKWNFRESVKKGRQKRRNRIDGKEAEEERKRRKVGENERKLRREKVGRRRKRSGLVRGKIERSSKDLSPLSLFPSIAFRSFLSYFERNFLSQGWTQSLEIAFTASKTFCLGKKVSLSLSLLEIVALYFSLFPSSLFALFLSLLDHKSHIQVQVDQYKRFPSLFVTNKVLPFLSLWMRGKWL